MEYNTFLITSLASSKDSLLRSGLTLAASLAPGEPGSLLSVDDIDTTDWLTFGDMGVIWFLLNRTVKATNHLSTDSLALIILRSDSMSLTLRFARGVSATEKENAMITIAHL